MFRDDIAFNALTGHLVKQRNLIFSVLFFISPVIHGQAPSLYEMDFRKDFVSWAWRANLEFDIKTGSRSNFFFSNQFVSTLFQQTSEDKWRDENSLGITWVNPISSKVSAHTELLSRIFSDENTVRRFNKNHLAQEVSFQLHPNVQFKPAVGVATEEAFDNADAGWYSRARLKISRLDMGGYLNYTDFNSEIRGFPGRNNQEHSLFTSWSKKFSQYSSDSLWLGFQYNENRYYIAPSNEITDPIEQVLVSGKFLTNQLQYQPGGNSAFAFITTLRDRDVRQDNPFQETARRRQEFELENRLEYLVFLGTWQFRTGMVFSQRDDNNDPGIDSDINTLQSSFRFGLQYAPTANDRLWSNFSYTKFEYNTPDILNSQTDLNNIREDRDEVRFIYDGGYQHRWSPYFVSTLTGQMYLNHQIYIRSGRSLNNNWNRVFQLAASFNHRVSERLRHWNQAKILSNFTVFDFEEFFPEARSFVFRKLTYTDTLKFQLTDNLSLNNFYQLELEDNGTFFQDDFSQLVTKELIAHFINLYFEHTNVFGLKIAPGVSYFFRDEWLYNSRRERIKVREFRSLTPRLTITYPASNRLILYFTFAPNRAENAIRSVNEIDFRNNLQYFTSGQMKLIYNF